MAWKRAAATKEGAARGSERPKSGEETQQAGCSSRPLDLSSTPSEFKWSIDAPAVLIDASRGLSGLRICIAHLRQSLT
jgi:hypothetical protein